MISRLTNSQLFRDYAQSFEQITGLSLGLRDADDWPPSRRGRKCGNAFCALMVASGRICVACEQAKGEADSSEPRTVTCLAGLCDSGVPVQRHGVTIGFLEIGGLLLHPPSQRQFDATLEVLRRWELPFDRAQLQASYFRSPQVSVDQHQSILRLLTIFARHLSLLAEQPASTSDGVEPAPVTNARAFIKEHYRDRLSLGAVARAVSVSPAHFSRLFKKTTLLSFTNYLAWVRVEQAKQMLSNPGLRINEIAFAVGFQSVPHFNRVFKKLNGVSPRAYRGREAESAKKSA